MRNLPQLKAQIRRHEGFRARAYLDTEGFLTIGYGRNLDAKGISESEADFLLDEDIKDAAIKAAALPEFEHLDPVRQCVLVNMTFNLGSVWAFKRMRAALRARDYDKAADEMLNSKWARQVKGRATELAAQMRTGKWA